MPFNVESLQAVMWIQGWQPRNTIAAAQALLESAGQLLDGDPVIPPRRSGAGAVEIIDDSPVLALRSRSNEFGLSLAGTRLDFFQRYVEGNRQLYTDLAPTYVGRLPTFATCLRDRLGARITRLAFVASVFAERAGSVEFLIGTFLREPRFFAGAQTLEMSAHHVVPVAPAGNTNRWIRVKSLRRAADNIDAGVAVEVDLNTVPEPIGDFQAAEVGGFFEAARQHVQQQLAGVPLT